VYVNVFAGCNKVDISVIKVDIYVSFFLGKKNRRTNCVLTERLWRGGRRSTSAFV